jgi:L-rhamnose isomerase / sugar isomerase
MATQAYDVLTEELSTKGINVRLLEQALTRFKVETPSWGYGNSGTRFGVFREPGAARDVHERLQDAAQVHRMTGATPVVAIHIPWDKVDDWDALKQEADELGVTIGAVNPNVFQDPDYKYGSLTNVDPVIRKKALDQILECVEIMKSVDSHVLSLWFADGSNYPGQANMRKRKRWMQEGLHAIHEALPDDARMLIEYKLFEPGFYHTDLPDWGLAMLMCKHAGEKAQVLVDTGHHAQGVNIEHIVCSLMDEKLLGGFHFNNRKYADDDLTVGSINPYEIFLIFVEILAGEREGLQASTPIAYMIDQSHIVKQKIEAMIQSIMNIQMLYAKALLVDVEALEDARSRNDAVDAERTLQAAYQTDVRPLLEKIRKSASIPIDPIQGHRESNYLDNATSERAGAIEGGSSWG